MTGNFTLDKVMSGYLRLSC